MARSRRALLGTLAVLALLIGPAAFAAPARAGDPCYHGFEPPALGPEATTSVRAMPCAFDPAVAVVPVGATVTFRSGTGAAHLVTGANQAWGDRDAELQPNSTVSYSFTRPGVYPYACALHRGMSGVIVVGDGGGALADVATLAAPLAAPEPPAGTDATTVALIGLAGALTGALAVFVASRRRPRAVDATAFGAAEDLAAHG